MICISKTCFITCWDYIYITCVHEDDKDIRNFNHLSQKANLKHIILSKPFWACLSFFFLYPYVSLNFLYVFLLLWPRISRAYTYWYLMDHGWKLCEKKWKIVMLDERWAKLPKVRKKEENEKERKRKE